MKGVIISVLVVLAMVQFFMVNPGEAAVRCDQVNECLASCIPYLTSGAGNPSAQCCSGVGKLHQMAQTIEDKQAACNCAKQAAARFPTIREDAASSLPAKCNVQINFPISRNTDCQNIHRD